MPSPTLAAQPILELSENRGVTGSTDVASLDDTLTHRSHMLQLIRDNLSRAQLRMCSQANAHRQDRTFKVGDWVWLRLQSYRQISVRGSSSPKLAKRYFGPFKVLSFIGKMAYELELPSGSRLHPVFHISKLKPFHGPPSTQINPLLPSILGTHVELRPLKVLGERTLLTPNGPLQQFLVQWDGISDQEATWEDAKFLQTSYPNLNLEDKVVLGEQSNDAMPSPTLAAQPVEDPISPKQQIGPIERGKRMRKQPNWMVDYQ